LLSRKMINKLRTQSAKILILTAVIILGLAGISNAAEVQFEARNMIITSDNIHRAPAGDPLEMSGYHLVIQGDLILSSDLGAGKKLELGAGAGWESIGNGGIINSDIFDFRLNLNIPLSGTGYVEVVASTSDRTEEPELTDVSQVRVRTRASEIELKIEKEASPKFSWWVGLSNRTERRFDRNFVESQFEMGCDLALDRRRSLIAEAEFSEGTEEVEEDSWTSYLVSIDFPQQFDRITSGGYRVAWEDQKLEQADGTSDWSNMLSAVAYYEMEMSSGWWFSSELGVDGIKPVVVDRRWEPRAMLDLGSSPERRLRVAGGFSTSSTLMDPFEDQVAWTRDSQLHGRLIWSVSRTYTVEPSVQFVFADLFGNGIADRTDETMILRVASQWVPARDWSIDLNAHREERISSQSVYDLFENRLELILSVTF
jgi:hypothetical protein